MKLGVYYNLMLKDTFMNMKEARKYIKQEGKDPNCNIKLFKIVEVK